MRILHLSAAVVVVSLAGGVALGAKPEWKVGLARVKITPEGPVRMAGYGGRTKPSTGVALDLYAKAVAIKDAGGRRGVLVTTDLIGIRAALAEAICGEISRKTGLRRRQIVLNSSHTHTGPTLGLDAGALGFPPEQAKATVGYTRRLQRQIVELVAASLKKLEPARLSYGVGVATFVMNRREFTDRGVILGVNPRGLVDRGMPVLRIDSPDGKLRCVLFGAACHNTTLTGKDREISGDFAGYAQRHLERGHSGVQAMFVQGCAGDANPFPRGSEAIARRHGLTLGTEVDRVLKSKLRPVRGGLRVALSDVRLPLQPPPSKERLEAMSRRGGWQRFVARRMQALRREGKKPPTEYTTKIAVWQFGDDLTLVALPGEVVVDYVTLLERSLGRQRLWIAAYCNDVFGYLPSARVLKQGGYETRGLYAGGVGSFSPRAQDVLVQAVRRLAKQVGRPATK